MSMSGIDVSEETKALYNEMKLKKTRELLVMQIVNKKVIEANLDLSKDTCTNDEMYNFLKDNQNEPFFLVHDFKVTDGGSGKLILISWVPDNSPVMKKMIYASTKDAIKSKFDGIKVNVQASGLDDIDLEEIKSKAKSA